MTVVRGHDDIRDAYRDERVARQYVGERFTQPLGAMLHARQVAAVRRVVAALSPARALEIAPGPARLTVETAPLLDGRLTVLDASAEMLAEARRRLAAAGAPRIGAVRADAFALPFPGTFDLVYTFRLIRHFERADRLRLYREAARVLRPGGQLVFDAVNETVSAPFRKRHPEGHQHYDALVRPADLRQELAESGFEIVSLEGVQRRFTLLYQLQVLVAPRAPGFARLAMELCDRTGGEPLEWIVTCRRTDAEGMRV